MFATTRAVAGSAKRNAVDTVVRMKARHVESAVDKTLRIIVEQLNGQWVAYFEARPEVAFGGRTPTEAVFRLTGPDEKPETWRDRPPML